MSRKSFWNDEIARLEGELDEYKKLYRATVDDKFARSDKNLELINSERDKKNKFVEAVADLLGVTEQYMVHVDASTHTVKGYGNFYLYTYPAYDVFDHEAFIKDVLELHDDRLPRLNALRSKFEKIGKK